MHRRWRKLLRPQSSAVVARTIRAADVTTAVGVIKYQVVDTAAVYLLAGYAGVTRL